MKARILCSAPPAQHPRPPASASAKNAPPVERGHSYSAAVAPDPGLRGWTNHDDSPSVQGDSVKATGPFGGAVGKTLRCGQRHTLHARAAERRDPSAILERHCPTRLDLKAFNRLLGQRSDDLVNIAAISAGRFQSQIGRVRQDNPKGPPVSNPWLERCHHECLCHRVTTPLPRARIIARRRPPSMRHRR
jgi:hypothetical protein